MKYLKYTKAFEGKEEDLKKVEAELEQHRKDAEAKVDEFFGEYSEEFDKVQTPQELAAVFGKLIKARGIKKVLGYVKDLIANNKKESMLEKQIAELKGEKWEEDPDMKAFNGLFSNPLNIAKLINGKDMGAEIEYAKKDGGEAEGEIKSAEIADDGTVTVTINNDKVGEVKKDITELLPNEDESSDLPKKLSDLKAKDPASISKVLGFADFISNPENKDKISEIDKILGA